MRIGSEHKSRRSFTALILAVSMAPLSWGGPPGDAGSSPLQLELEQLEGQHSGSVPSDR